MLDIFVKVNKLTIKDPIIASDTIDYLTCKVHFESEEWAEYSEITAFISNGTTSYNVPVVDGVISEDNHIEVSEGMWTIYIQGIRDGAVRLFTNADTLWVTHPGGIEGYPYIKVPADISFQSYLIAKNAEYIASNAGGGGSLAGEGDSYKGEVSALPATASKGEIYKVTTESVPTGKLLITVSGVNVIEQNPDLGDGGVYTGFTRLDIDTNTDIYRFLEYAKGGYYSEFGVSFNSYIENAGVKYTVPWITTSSFGNDSDDILLDTNKSFEALLVNGNNLVCYADDMTYLPQTLKDNFIKYPAGTCFVYDGTKWVALDSDILAELALRVSRGTSGAMVFIDEVDALPATANKGDVYTIKTAGDWTLTAESISYEACEVVDGRLAINNYGGSEDVLAVKIKEAVEKAGGYPAKIKLADDYSYITYLFTHDLSEDYTESGGPFTTYFYGEILEASDWDNLNLAQPSNVYYSVPKKVAFLYDGSEWVEL